MLLGIVIVVEKILDHEELNGKKSSMKLVELLEDLFLKKVQEGQQKLGNRQLQLVFKD